MALEHPWSEPPAPGEVIGVAPGIKWLRTPLPFDLNHINLWLLEDGPGWTVMDTGVGLDDTRAQWEQIFATHLDGRPVTRVVVTHFHPDHMGNAGWLTERWRAALWCAQAEWLYAQWAWRARELADAAPRLAHYRRHGCGEELLAKLPKRMNPYPHLVPTLAPAFHRILDGDVLVIGGRRWEVLTVFGHAPEHVCLWNREDGVLISGDQVLPKITTNISVWPEQAMGNPLRLYLDSFGRFRPIPAGTLVLPSHGLPFHGLHDRIEQLRLHHDARLAEAVDALVEPRTAAEVVPALFRRDLDLIQLNFALGETLAHLNYLEADGRVARLVGEDGIHRFLKA